ncbi:hypothetical protein SBA7_1210008 [Candidatus Sulfotelmatobacter sp. SbA7]|nr:hypothetical protein SBA7_1210008 [Candidatus Sulfotelmatobacter sp. SbA7]
MINVIQLGRHVPQGLKPALLLALGGTAEAVPFPKPSMKPVLGRKTSQQLQGVLTEN